MVFGPTNNIKYYTKYIFLLSHQIRLAPKPIKRHVKRIEPALSTRYCFGQLVVSSALHRMGYFPRSFPNLSSMLLSLSMMVKCGS